MTPGVGIHQSISGVSTHRFDLESIDRYTKVHAFTAATQRHRRRSLGQHLGSTTTPGASRSTGLRISAVHIPDAVDVGDITVAADVKLPGRQAAAVHADRDCGLLPVVAGYPAAPFGMLINRRPSGHAEGQMAFHWRAACLRRGGGQARQGTHTQQRGGSRYKGVLAHGSLLTREHRLISVTVIRSGSADGHPNVDAAVRANAGSWSTRSRAEFP